MNVLLPLLIAQTGALTGTVRYEGQLERPEPFAVDVDRKSCGRAAPIRPEDLVVESGALANAAVILLVPPEAISPQAPARLDQENCTFAPHLQAVTHGSELIIGNSDPIIHNVHARVGGETVFNLGMPLPRITVKRMLDRIGVHEISCDSGHWWMRAYVLVIPHRFHATTGRDGTFTIPEVPAGKHGIAVWHERLGLIEQEVEVKPGETAQVSVSFAETKTGRDTEQRLTELLRGPKGSATEPASRLDDQRAQVQREGRGLFQGHCAHCHGARGDGRGESAPFLSSPPRDFTRGEFKFRTTSSGRAPTAQDVLRTISVGIPGADMPAFKRRLTRDQRELLAQYVLAFSVKPFATQSAEAISIPAEPPGSPGSLVRGRELYEKLECAQCHGPDGDGNGAKEKSGRAADLTKGYYRGGRGIRVVFRTLSTGLSGSPMPAFLQISDQERWDLARYVVSLSRRGVGQWLLDPDVGRRSTP
jgi:mono/diheme cytochrome c family protein